MKKTNLKIQTKIQKTLNLVLLYCLAFLLPSCSWFSSSTKSTSGNKTQPERQTIAAGQSISVKVDETDLLLPDEASARNYLGQKLIALMAKDLLSLGFDAKQAETMAKSAQKKDLFVRGHLEKIMGQGKDAGKIFDKTLWDVRGALQVSLSDAILDDLYKKLDFHPLSSMDDVAHLESVFRHMDEIRIPKIRFDALRKKVGDKWVKLLQPWMKTQFEIPVQPIAQYLDTMQRVSLVLADFHKAHPRHPGFASLEKSFTLAAIKAVRSFEIKSENFEAIKNVLNRVQKIAGELMPGLMGYMKRDLELAWRDYLVAMDDKKESFVKMRDGFVYFLELFPKSQFYPDLELRFLSRWYDHLTSIKPQDLPGLEEMLREVNLFHKRFSRFDGLKDVDLAMGKNCVSVLSKVKIPDLEYMARIDAALSSCEPYLHAGQDTLSMRDRIERIEQKLTNARDDKWEKEALADLDFFVQWDRAVEDMPWGAQRSKWKTKGAFVAKWNKGKDAGADCKCTLDPEEPCRIFDDEGPAGGFEVVIRFADKRLSGVDLCEVYTGNKMEAIYRFFTRRYQALHSGRQAAEFLAGTRNTNRLSFVKGDRIHVTLERTTDTCTVRYRSVKMMTEAEKKKKEEAAKEAEQRAKARRERIEKGWSPGQCVRWDCKPVCQYRGRTKTRKDKRYMVTITQSRKSPVEEGSEVWVLEDELYDCQ